MGDDENEVRSAHMLGCEISTNPLDPLEPILKMCEYHLSLIHISEPTRP